MNEIKQREIPNIKDYLSDTEQMNFDESDSESELLLLNDRTNRSNNLEAEYINPRVNRRRRRSSPMASIKQLCCG